MLEKTVATKKSAIIAIYGGGFLVGAAFVFLPSLGKILRDPPYSLSSSIYGLLYFPEIVGAILSALSAGFLQDHFKSKGVFRIGIFFNTIAMILLSIASFIHSSSIYPFLLFETLFYGIGFGLTLAAINHYAAFLFPDTQTKAVTILNALIGGATAVSPIILGFAQSLFSWGIWSIILLIGFVLVFFIPLPQAQIKNSHKLPLRLNIIPFMLAVLIYAICEGSFGSWANVYVSINKGQQAYYGILSLSLFWASMTVFRFIIALVPKRLVPHKYFYFASAISIGLCFLILPALNSALALVLAFVFAGAACSIYYPFSMSYGLINYPQQQTKVAGLMVAALMVGEGIGSFGLGPLQNILPLEKIYLFSALWAIPLFILALKLSRKPVTKQKLA
ncbi:MFS transporter [Desulfurella sp.]|uniref:MFS transporter n=1 Tax=Desulfurella sp. TaxID=1962857 RepID=UPI003D0CC824